MKISNAADEDHWSNNETWRKTFEVDKMAMVNQKGEPVHEETLFECWSIPSTPAEKDTAIGLILNHLGMTIVRTNATKHGNIELELRKQDD